MLMNTFSPKQNTVILSIYQNNNDTMIKYDIQKKIKFARSHLKEHLKKNQSNAGDQYLIPQDVGWKASGGSFSRYVTGESPHHAQRKETGRWALSHKNKSICNKRAPTETYFVYVFECLFDVLCVCLWICVFFFTSQHKWVFMSLPLPV